LFKSIIIISLFDLLIVTFTICCQTIFLKTMSQNNKKIVEFFSNILILTTSLLNNFIKFATFFYYVISISFLKMLKVLYFDKLNIIDFLN